MTLGAKFEGSNGSDAFVYDLGSAVGYNFSRQFGVDAGVPFYFVSTPSSIKKNNPGAVSGIGAGAFFTDLRLNYPNKSLNCSSVIHLTAPIRRYQPRFPLRFCGEVFRWWQNDQPPELHERQCFHGRRRSRA